MRLALIGPLPADVREALGTLTDRVLELDSKAPPEKDIPVADMFVIGHADNGVLKFALRVHSFDPIVPILIYGEDPYRIRRQLMFTPAVGPSVQAIGPDQVATLADVVHEALDSANKRRRYEGTIAEMNHALATAGAMPALSGSLLGPLLDFAPIGIVLADEQGSILAANPHAEKIAHDLARPRGLTIGSLFPQHQERVNDLLKTSLTPIGPVMLELQADGQRKFVEVTAAPVIDEKGRRLLFLLHDVTARIETEHLMDEVRRSLLFQKSLLESQSEALADGVVVVGTDGKMISFNSRFLQMWNIPPAVTESRSDEAAIASVLDQVADPTSFVERINYLYEHPEEESRDELTLKDGRTFDRFSAPVVGESGELYGRVWFFRDVTETKRRERGLSLLAEATEAASATRDVRKTLHEIGGLIVGTLGDVCLFYLSGDQSTVSRVELTHSDPETEARLREAVAPFEINTAADEGVARVIREGVPILATFADAAMMAADVSDPEGLLRVISPLGIASWMCIPLQAQGETIGAMSVVSLDEQRRYDDQDLELALELGRRVSVGIASARVAERERRVAETLQRSLLPQNIVTISGLDIASRYVAGSEGMDVGGDWFEVIRLPDKKVLAVIGDVAGKGLRAAAVMGEIRMALKAYSLQSSSPIELVENLNRLVMETDEAPMATLLCAVIDLRAHEVTFVSAGHPPPLLIDPDGRPAFLNGGLRPPLGIPMRSNREATHRLLPGSMLILYTDGLVERRDRALDEGMKDILTIASQTPRITETMCEALIAAADPEGDERDDAAVLALAVESMAQTEIEITAPSQPKELANIRDTIERWLLANMVPPGSIEDTVIAVNEAAANAVEHAYGPGAGTFHIRAAINDGKIHVSVADKGGWRDHVPSDHGRGLMLIRSLMNEVDLERTPSGTTIRMARSIQPTDDTGEPEMQLIDETPPAPARFARIALSGDLDLARSAAAAQEILAQVNPEMTRIFLDLSKVSYIDSSGIRMLLQVNESLAARRQDLVVVLPRSSRLRRIFDIAGFSSVLQFAEKEEE